MPLLFSSSKVSLHFSIAVIFTLAFYGFPYKIYCFEARFDAFPEQNARSPCSFLKCGQILEAVARFVYLDYSKLVLIF